MLHRLQGLQDVEDRDQDQRPGQCITHQEAEAALMFPLQREEAAVPPNVKRLPPMSAPAAPRGISSISPSPVIRLTMRLSPTFATGPRFWEFCSREVSVSH